MLVIGGPAVFAGYVTDPALGGPRVSREGIVRDGWLDTGDLGMRRRRRLRLPHRPGQGPDHPRRPQHRPPGHRGRRCCATPRVRAAVAVGRPDRHSGEVPVAYVVPAGPGRFDEAELLAWAATAIDEPAARPKRIYPMTEIPVTAVGKHFKPALIADAAVRAITEALTAAGLADARVTAAHEDGRLVVTVTGADPDRVQRRRRRIRPHRPLRAVARRPDHQQVTRRKRHDHERPLPRDPGARRHRRQRQPAGCTAALLLADFGIPVTLLERYTQPHPLPRAVHLDDEVARILDRIGVSEGFLARSRPGSGLRLLDAGHRVMAEFRREHQAGQHGFPQANMFHQPDLEELLLARVEAHPLIDLRRGAEVIGLDDDDAPGPLTAAPVRVHARIAGEPQTFTGRVVLGCDGANSTIRELTGITMDDLGFTERWLVVDIQAEDRP